VVDVRFAGELRDIEQMEKDQEEVFLRHFGV